MIKDAFLQLMKKEFPFSFTQEQEKIARQLCDFILTPDPRSAFILRGYAGTGKTTLVSALARVLQRLERQVVLMSPTGRAAKVLSSKAGHAAYTIHKVIYRQKHRNDRSAGFTLNYNKWKNTLFIIDESSMISNVAASHVVFGSGHLMDDLIEFVYSGNGCRILFMGDTAQLPPVGENEGPALQAACVAEYGLHVTSSELSEVVRQSQKSGILYNATQLRKHLMTFNTTQIPSLRFSGFNDLHSVPGDELIEALEHSYDHFGTDQTIVITRSNKRAVVYNRGIRSTIFGRDGMLTKGDVVMIARNNYYWTEKLQSEMGQANRLPMDFIANGDIAIVSNIKHFTELYGLHFADTTLTFPDYDGFEMNVRVILDALHSETPALPDALSEQLYHAVMDDLSDYPTKRQKLEQLGMDPNYNALQIKYAYAVTCHKAQGGQWKHVFIDQGWIPGDGVDSDYYRWLYTAFTRAESSLDLVNWPTDKSF